MARSSDFLTVLKNIATNLFYITRRRVKQFHASSPRKKMLAYSKFILPAVILYYEIIFRLSTVGGLFKFSFFLTLGFSVCWGLLGYYLCSLSKKPKTNRRIKLALIVISAIPFIIEYFVFRKFNTLYDVNTVFRGAGDVVGSNFMGDAMKMVFSFSGLAHVFLFLLPTILYAVFGAHFDPARVAKKSTRIKTGAIIIATYLVTLLFVTIIPSYHLSYGQQYNFETASSHFGFLTGLRLDAKNMIFGSSASFETVSQAPAPSEIPDEDSSLESSSTAEPEVIDYGPSVMDIDFDALMANDSDTYLSIDEYVSSLTPSSKNEYTGLFKGKNLIFLSAEAFSAEVIDEELTPTLYRMATKGINVADYLQPEIAGTTGGEYHNLFGMICSNGGASMEDVVENYNPFIMGNQLNALGYKGYVYHNNTYSYYNRDYTHNMLGYSEGYIGYGNGIEEYVERSWPESDLQMIEGSLKDYIDCQPFNVYYMTVSGHSDYTTYDNMMSYKNWSEVENLDYSDPVKCYLAANLELEKAMAYLVKALEDAGIADDTVIVISADHFPYGLDDDGALGELPYLSELYGYDVETYLQRDHNRLIIWSGCLEKMDPIVVDSPVSSIDVLPTLNNLFGLEWDSRLLPGRDILSDAEAIVFNNAYDWKTDMGTYIASTDTFTPTDPTATVSSDYISRIQTIVRNKLSYCSSVLNTDYFGHVFGVE